MRPARTFAASLLLALATACGPGENEPGPGGVTVDEAQALDEAAAMLEERKLPPEVLDAAPVGEQGNESPAAADNERNEPDAR